jgi:hypothetical protein
MRLIKLVSLAAYCAVRFAAEECRLKEISNSAGHLVIFSVVFLISSEACADSPASTAPPQVNLWYGNYQTFGANGVPQQWVNILGNVASPVGIAMLTYSLNGAPDANLNWDPTNPRLVEAGDFNADIDYALLWPGLNNVVITATDYLNQSTQQTVSINNAAVQLASDVGNFVVDFRQVTNATLQNWVQIVDGVWDIGIDGRIRTTQTGYDRAFLIGDTNISGSYDVRTEFVLHSYDSYWGWAFGAASGWLGHTLDNYGYPDPSQPYIGHPFPAWGVIGTDSTGIDSYRIYTNFVPLYETELSDNNTAPAVALETPYMYHYRVKANSDGLTSHNSLNVWPKGTTEPSQWMVEADTPTQAGSILFDAHNVDVSIGPIIEFIRLSDQRTNAIATRSAIRSRRY